LEKKVHGGYYHWINFLTILDISWAWW